MVADCFFSSRTSAAFRNALLLLTGLSGSLVTHCTAQQVDSKIFYEKDYAVAPNYRPGEVTVPASRTNSTLNEKTASNAAPLRLGTTLGQNAPENAQGEPSPHVATNFLELFVSSANQIHFEKVIAGLVRFLSDTKGKVSAVYHIGDFKNVRPELESQLQKLGVVILPVTQTPQDIKVETSPTWVLHTPQGQYIIEGAMDVTPFISPTGEYQLPVKAAPSPTVTQKMGGF